MRNRYHLPDSNPPGEVRFRRPNQSPLFLEGQKIYKGKKTPPGVITLLNFWFYKKLGMIHCAGGGSMTRGRDDDDDE